MEDDFRLPHACVIAAASREAALRRAEELARAAVCSGPAPRPCGVCRDCRKALAGLHPDIRVVSRLTDEKGRPKQNIGVDQIRELSADAIVLPNESARKVYILDEAETMNPPAQNAALKLLEEPPADAVFLLCTCNPQLLLPTVRSRCTLLSAAPEAEQAPDEEARALAEDYFRCLSRRDEAELFRWCVQNEGMDARALLAFTDAARAGLTDMLCRRRESALADRGALLRLCAVMDEIAQALRVNTGVKQLLGLLAVSSAFGPGNRG